MLADIFFHRLWWCADLIRPLVLQPRRGCRHVMLWRRSLEIFDEYVELGEALIAATGDRFMVCGPELEDIAIMTVAEVAGNRVTVTLDCGALSAGTRTVQMVSCNGLSRQQRKRSA